MEKSEAKSRSVWHQNPCSGFFCHPDSLNQVLENIPSKSLLKTSLPTQFPQKSRASLRRTSGICSFNKERPSHGASQPLPGPWQVESQAGLCYMRISIHPCAPAEASTIISIQKTCSFPALLLVTLRRVPPWECTPIFIAKGPKGNLRSQEPVPLPPALRP